MKSNCPSCCPSSVCSKPPCSRPCSRSCSRCCMPPKCVSACPSSPSCCKPAQGTPLIRIIRHNGQYQICTKPSDIINAPSGPYPLKYVLDTDETEHGKPAKYSVEAKFNDYLFDYTSSQSSFILDFTPPVQNCYKTCSKKSIICMPCQGGCSWPPNQSESTPSIAGNTEKENLNNFSLLDSFCDDNNLAISCITSDTLERIIINLSFNLYSCHLFYLTRWFIYLKI